MSTNYTNDFINKVLISPILVDTLDKAINLRLEPGISIFITSTLRYGIIERLLSPPVDDKYTIMYGEVYFHDMTEELQGYLRVDDYNEIQVADATMVFGQDNTINHDDSGLNIETSNDINVKTNNNVNMVDKIDNLKIKFDVLNGELYLVDGTSRVYHEGYKPTKTDVGLDKVENLTKAEIIQGLATNQSVDTKLTGKLDIDATSVNSAKLEGFTKEQIVQEAREGLATETDVTTHTHGLMTPEDKVKLDGIDEGANNYTLPTASSETLGGVKIGDNIDVSSDGTVSVAKATASKLGLIKIGSSLTTNELGVTDVNLSTIANKAYVDSRINALIDGAPGTLDTLKEISDAITSNGDTIQAINAAIGNKVDKVSGKQLSTNDFTNAQREKVDNLSKYTAPTYIGALPTAGGTMTGNVTFKTSNGLKKLLSESGSYIGLENGRTVISNGTDEIIAVNNTAKQVVINGDLYSDVNADEFTISGIDSSQHGFFINNAGAGIYDWVNNANILSWSKSGDKITFGKEIYVGSNKVYHQGNKPTTRDIEWLPFDVPQTTDSSVPFETTRNNMYRGSRPYIGQVGIRGGSLFLSTDYKSRDPNKALSLLSQNVNFDGTDNIQPLPDYSVLSSYALMFGERVKGFSFCKFTDINSIGLDTLEDPLTPYNIMSLTDDQVTINRSIHMASDDLVFQASDAGDVVFKNPDGTEKGRIYTSGNNMTLRAGGETANFPSQIYMNSDKLQMVSKCTRIINKVIVDANRLSADQNPSISLAIGDGDTGFNWNSDGSLSYWANYVKKYDLNSVYHPGNRPFQIASSGRPNALTGTQTNASNGLQMKECYGGTNYPYSHGNIISLKGVSASGCGELFMGWNPGAGSGGASAPLYYRNKRDVESSGWSPWEKIYTMEYNAHWIDFGGSTGYISTATFISMLKSMGAFSQYYWCKRGSWSYAGNKCINDTGCGNIKLAGAVVEKFGSDGAYTIRITTPTTTTEGGVPNSTFTYVNNGSDYSPSWRIDFNNRNCTISKAQNGYAKFPNGLILQWGRFDTTTTTGDVSHPVTFPSAFTSINYSVSITHYNSALTNIAAQPSSTSQFTFWRHRTSTSGVSTIRWIAVGY